MAETRMKMAAIDPVWQRIGEEAVEAIRSEPLLGGLVHSSLLHHASMERALAYRFSLKLASGEMSEQILREIADEAYGDLERSLENANAWSVSSYHWQLKSLVATDAYFSKLDGLTPDQKKTSLKKMMNMSFEEIPLIEKKKSKQVMRLQS